MNEFLPSRFVESVKRLAIGLEPIDAAVRLRPSHPIDVTFDVAPFKLPRPAIDHHRTGLHVLLYTTALTSPVDLRFVDRARRYVPRRLRIPILTQAAAEAAPPARRVRRPVLFPGAAYDVADATGLRGRVVRGGQPMRWARVVARLPGAGPVVGRAHGDDRGEFLLLIGSEAGPIGDLDPPLKVEVTVFGPAIPPAPITPDQPAIDALWDLPLETAAAPGDPDPVSSGEQQPASYTASAMLPLDLAFGRVLSGVTFTIA
jgi:hypothetical protein